MPTFETQPTPNPDSLKITMDEGSFIEDGMQVFSSAAQAEGHALGEALFKINGVDDVFVTPAFLTVTKAPGATWERLLPVIKRALADFYADA